MSLWDLTQKRLQPDFQYMDSDTLSQIVAHKSIFSEKPLAVQFSNEDIITLRTLAPVENIFLEKKIIHSIHGVAHAVRVMIYSFVLARLNGYTEFDTNLLLHAASWHDTQRLNDRGDEGHEKRVIDLIGGLDYDNHFKICLIDLLQGSGNLSQLLRTADALDRYRLPKVKWWINDDNLSLKPDDAVKVFAFELIVKSETDRLQGIGEIESVLSHLFTK